MSIRIRGVFDPRWVFHHRGVASSFQVCSVDIYNENLSARTYNPTTNTWTADASVIWSGNARIQPVKTSSQRNVMTDSTFVREVSVQIDFAGTSIVDIRPGNYLIVTNSPYDQMLKKFVYVVRSVMGSSNPWQRTLICEVDMETDPSA